jgi:hypothetical protein
VPFRDSTAPRKRVALDWPFVATAGEARAQWCRMPRFYGEATSESSGKSETRRLVLSTAEVTEFVYETVCSIRDTSPKGSELQGYLRRFLLGATVR